MSGIAGIIRFDGGPVHQDLVARMTQSMAYRGQDGITHWADEHAALGHCMLQTTPESLEETQPLSNEDQTLHLVMDGRVDNWEELRRLLESEKARLRTRSDAELVLRAFERWGEACLDHIDGDFALAIWDSHQRKVFCARDRTGAKPFVYFWDGNCLVFASEIQAVLAGPNVPQDLNLGTVAENLTVQWLSRDETLWQGVSRLIAARHMTVDKNGPRIAQYWHPDQIPLLQFRTESDYVERYREVLFEVIRRQSRSHRPVGFEVSGGLDSSAMFSIADELHRAGRLPAPDIAGYTLKFDQGTDAYELDFAHAVGAHRGRKIAEIPPTYRSVDWLKSQAAKLGTVPNLPNGLMQLGMYEAHERSGGRVIVNGTGGDQWLDAGENDLAECLQLGDWRSLRKSLSEDYAVRGGKGALYGLIRHGIYPNLPAQVRKVARWALQSEEAHTRRSFPWLSPSMQDLLKDRLNKAEDRLAMAQSHLRIGLRERLMSLEGGYPSFARETMERTGSMAGVEYRSPFYSRAFLEMALGLPLTQLRRARQDRLIHRQAMKGILPENVRLRDSKAEFGVASDPYKQQLAQIPFPTALPEREWFSPQGLSEIKKDILKPGIDVRFFSVGILICVASTCEISNNIRQRTK